MLQTGPRRPNLQPALRTSCMSSGEKGQYIFLENHIFPFSDFLGLQNVGTILESGHIQGK